MLPQRSAPSRVFLLQRRTDMRRLDGAFMMTFGSTVSENRSPRTSSFRLFNHRLRGSTRKSRFSRIALDIESSRV